MAGRNLVYELYERRLAAQIESGRVPGHVGVILDGAATGTGDISRGARYNSAIRYLAGRGKGSMVIIVSEEKPTRMRANAKRK